MSFDINNVTERIVELGEEWADNNAAAEILEETKSTLLAELKTFSAEKSDAARETEAKANPRYKKHLEHMVEARRLANRSKVNYEAAKTWTDLLRTKEANLRAEMKL